MIFAKNLFKEPFDVRFFVTFMLTLALKIVKKYILNMEAIICWIGLKVTYAPVALCGYLFPVAKTVIPVAKTLLPVAKRVIPVASSVIEQAPNVVATCSNSITCVVEGIPIDQTYSLSASSSITSVGRSVDYTRIIWKNSLVQTVKKLCPYCLGTGVLPEPGDV